MRMVWSVALLSTLLLFAHALATTRTTQSAGEIEANLYRNAENEIGISPIREGAVARAGVYEGDVLVAVNDIPVSAIEHAESILHRAVGGSVALTVRTGNFPERRVTVIPRAESRRLLGTIGLSGELSTNLGLIVNVLFALVCMGTALIIAWKKWSDGVALLVSLTIVVVLLGASLPIVTLFETNGWLYTPLAAWFMLVLGLLLTFFFLFPNGRFVPHQTRWLLLLFAGWTLLGLLNSGFYPWQWTPLAYTLFYVALVGIGVLAQSYRYRASATIEDRQQIRWVLFGTIAAVLGLFVQILPRGLGVESSDASELAYSLLLYPLGLVLALMLPVSIALAILRYHLWDIDLVVNRTLVYGSLTLCIVGMYVLGVGLLGALVHSPNNLVVSLMVTGVVAVVFQPLRERLQRGVNRFMYGQRDEPYTAVAQLGRRMTTMQTPDSMLPVLVESIAQTLKLPYVAIETKRSGQREISAQYGRPSESLLRLPMQYQSVTVGSLMVAPRGADEALNGADLDLLTTLAQQTAAVVYAAQLTLDLQESRERLVIAREEERRRIRRDLHDGLGPTLAVLAMEADAAREFADIDVERSKELLVDVTGKAQAAIQDVRRLVYNLRPPALDELGLAAALEQHAQGLSERLHLTLHVIEPLPPLPAAVEVAAFRIAQEALNNVVKHANARTCTLCIAITEALQLEIQDDGVGIPADVRSGVGLISMRERAAELGGTCLIVTVPGGGTRVTAHIPLSRH